MRKTTTWISLLALALCLIVAPFVISNAFYLDLLIRIAMNAIIVLGLNLLVGFAGQIAFTGRFVLQWLYSEYKKRSVIPTSFWYLSIVGSALLLTYAIYRQDPVFIIGQSFGFLVYLRNLQLIARNQEQKD